MKKTISCKLSEGIAKRTKLYAEVKNTELISSPVTNQNISSNNLTNDSPDCEVLRKNEQRLDDSFYEKSCTLLANALLGKVLVRKLKSGEILKGKIVETESYLGVEDKASHSYKGKRTDRNEAMFLNPGTAYVYSIYGMYYCFNISSAEEGSAVLIRAVEPLQGLLTMQQFRSVRRKQSTLKNKDLCNGPSKLCQAFQIEKRALNKVDLSTSNDLWLEYGTNFNPSDIISCKRIGIDSYGEEWANKPLRYYVKNCAYVSLRNKAAERLHEEVMA